MPGDDTDLETPYTEEDVDKVSSNNEIYVDQTGTGEYMIHQFKNFVGGKTSCQVDWNGKSTFAPKNSGVHLEVYNHTTNHWDEFDGAGTEEANEEFFLSAQVDDLTNYKDNDIISCRVWQEAI